MTLHIIHSNKVERLHDELCYLLKNDPLPNPFEAETIVCPSKAMARWVHIRFTQQMGIAAHYDYPMPLSWVWQLATHCLNNVPEQDPLQRDVLAWKIFHNLANIEHADNYIPIQNYLENDANSTKRWSLAKKIALVFERYQHYRPDLINQWNDNNQQSDEWQSALWHNLTSDIDTDRVQLLDQLGLHLSTLKSNDNIPKRVTFFLVSALPPLLLKNIQMLAKHTEVYFFVLSPSEHYWSDLVSLKQQAKQRLNTPELNDYFATGHELLASWGRQGQVFQDMLLYELDDAITQHHDVYNDDFNSTLLNQLQKSLFDLNEEIVEITADNSIRFNLCHSPLRECEVLHDQCLALLENNELAPEDILVIVPNMEQYVVTIEAVFKKSADQHNVKPFIPWNLSDSSLSTENPLIKTFLNVLTLPSSRFTVSDILAFLDCPDILQRFKLLETDKSIIREYIKQAHIHWGFDAKHKVDFDVPEMLQNTWQQAQQRFFSFYAIDETMEHNHIMPLQGFSSSRATVIAQFMLLLESLKSLRDTLAYSRTVKQWQVDLNIAIDVLFIHSDDGVIQVIRDAIDELVTQSHHENLAEQSSTEHPKLHRELIAQWMTDFFSNSQSKQRFFSGGISFCGMRPMRSVPFKVIVMLGINEHDFPRHNTPVEFDLMAEKWRPGDLLISDEDRYLFLEAILCAREHLIISYCASSLKDNSDKEPSNLVSELRDYLDTHFIIEHVDKIKISQQLSTQYAMHSFSSKNYGEEYRSYNKFWCSVAQQLHNKEEGIDEVLSTIKPESIDLGFDIELKRLIMCLKDPVKFYFNTQLNIRIYDEHDSDDDEPFDLDALQKWSLKDHLIKQNLSQKDYSVSSFSEQGLLPHGSHAMAYFDELESELEEQLESVHHYLSHSLMPIDLDLPLSNAIILKIKINNYYPNLGQLLITPSNFGSKPFIECWLTHCALCALELINDSKSSVLSCKDKTVIFKPLSKTLALQYLLDAVQLMQQATLEPLIVLPKSSFSYQFNLLIQDKFKALSEALSKWNGNSINEASLGEKDNNFIALAFKQFYEEPRELFESDDFKDMAQQMYGSAFKYCDFKDGL